MSTHFMNEMVADIKKFNEKLKPNIVLKNSKTLKIYLEIITLFYETFLWDAVLATLKCFSLTLQNFLKQ